MAPGIATFHGPALRIHAAGVLRRIGGAIAESLAGAWAGLQSVSRASMLEAARIQRGNSRGSAGTRTRRLP
jgi:hypothetical protein